MARLSDRNNNITFVPQPQSPDVAGFVKETSDDVVPDGWLECNGQAVSRTTYSELFAKIGTTYGAGDGSTTFNLPGGSLLTNPVVDGDVTVNTDQFFVESSTGHVGIGTTTPQYHSATEKALTIETTTANHQPGIEIRANTTSDTSIGSIYFMNSNSASSSERVAGIIASRVTSNNAANLAFQTSNSSGTYTTRMTLDPDGNLGIGTASPNGKLDVSSSGVTQMRLSTTSTTSQTILAFADNVVDGWINYDHNSRRMYFGAADSTTTPSNAAVEINNANIFVPTMANTSSSLDVNYRSSDGLIYYVSSIREHKDDIVDLPYGRKELLKIKPRQFTYKNDETKTPKYGLIVDELKPILPDLICADKKGDDVGFSSSQLIYVLIKGFQEQQAEIDTLKARLDALESI